MASKTHHLSILIVSLSSFSSGLRDNLNSFMIGSLLYRNCHIDLYHKSMNWFLYDGDLRHERYNPKIKIPYLPSQKPVSIPGGIITLGHHFDVA